MSAAPLIALEHVTVVRDLDRSGRPALDDVSLSIDAGEHVCILGPNGCGKSTLIKTITRECYPLAREGSAVRILGRDRWNVVRAPRRGSASSSPDLLAACSTDATGRDVVLSGFFSSTRIFRHHAPDAAQRARADALLARFGVAHLADVPVAHMSSGEAKRVLIARALVHDRASLLFDEPGNALDVAAHVALLDTMSSTRAMPAWGRARDAPRERDHPRDRARRHAARRGACRRRTEGRGAHVGAAVALFGVAAEVHQQGARFWLTTT